MVFKDRETSECGCPACITTLIHGWEELESIIAELVGHLSVCADTKHKLRCELQKKLESARRFLHRDYGTHLCSEPINCDGSSAHCSHFALSVKDQNSPYYSTCEKHGAQIEECKDCNQTLVLLAHVDELFDALKVPDSLPHEAASGLPPSEQLCTRTWPPTDSKDWKLKELQQFCKSLGLTVSGNKAELVARLCSHPDPRAPAVVHGAELHTPLQNSTGATPVSIGTTPIEADVAEGAGGELTPRCCNHIPC